LHRQGEAGGKDMSSLEKLRDDSASAGRSHDSFRRFAQLKLCFGGPAMALSPRLERLGCVIRWLSNRNQSFAFWRLWTYD
jgi:hypothetical protein